MTAYDPSHLISSEELEAIGPSGSDLRILAEHYNSLIRAGVPKDEAKIRMKTQMDKDKISLADISTPSDIGGERTSTNVADVDLREGARSESKGKAYVKNYSKTTKRRREEGTPVVQRDQPGGVQGGEAEWEREASAQLLRARVGYSVNPLHVRQARFVPAPDPASYRETINRFISAKRAGLTKGDDISAGNILMYGRSEAEAGTRAVTNAHIVKFQTEREKGNRAGMEAARAAYSSHIAQSQLTPGDIDTHIDIRMPFTKSYTERLPGTTPDMQICQTAGCQSDIFSAADIIAGNERKDAPIDSTLCGACNTALRGGKPTEQWEHITQGDINYNVLSGSSGSGQVRRNALGIKVPVMATARGGEGAGLTQPPADMAPMPSIAQSVERNPEGIQAGMRLLAQAVHGITNQSPYAPESTAENIVQQDTGVRKTGGGESLQTLPLPMKGVGRQEDL